MIRKSGPRESERKRQFVETGESRLTPQGRRRGTLEETSRKARGSNMMKDFTETIGYLWLSISLR